jgi:hypothetical protein
MPSSSQKDQKKRNKRSSLISTHKELGNHSPQAPASVEARQESLDTCQPCELLQHSSAPMLPFPPQQSPKSRLKPTTTTNATTNRPLFKCPKLPLFKCPKLPLPLTYLRRMDLMRVVSTVLRNKWASRNNSQSEWSPNSNGSRNPPPLQQTI